VSSEPGTVQEAVERNARAVMSGDFATLMADITPEALAEMMKMAPGATSSALQQLPNIESYEVMEELADSEEPLFHVTFRSALGSATLATRWKTVLGRWKITSVQVVSVDAPSPPAPLPEGEGTRESSDG
jgi:hypothetical protein